MNIDILEILDAYKTSFHPTELEKKRAEERAAICNTCSERKESQGILKALKVTHRCAVCGCILSGKIFSGKVNPCPLKKWAEVDREYIKSSLQSENKELI